MQDWIYVSKLINILTKTRQVIKWLENVGYQCIDSRTLAWLEKKKSLLFDFFFKLDNDAFNGKAE